MELAFIIAREVFTILLLVVTGIACKKTNILSEDTGYWLSAFLLVIVMPAQVIHIFESQQKSGAWPGILLMVVLCSIFHLILIGISKAVFHKADPDNNDWRINRLTSVLANCGFMGFPLMAVTTGEQGLLYGAVVVGIFNVVSGAWGAPMISGARASSIHRMLLRAPGFWGLLFGLALYALPFNLPAPISGFIGYVANLNTPLSMIIIGVFLAGINIKSAVRDVQVYKVVCLRNVIYPCIALLLLFIFKLLRLLPEGDTFALTFMIAAATPTAANTLLISARHLREGDHAAKIIFASTMLSVLTIPLMIYLASQIL